MRAVIALDQGTTSTRAIAVSEAGEVVCAARRAHHRFDIGPGLVEQDPAAMVRDARAVLAEIAAQLAERGATPEAVSIASQTETTVVWNRLTGVPVHPAISWQDTRGERIAAEFAGTLDGEFVRAITGSPLNGYFSATKLVWILDHVPGARRAAQTGDVIFGNVGTWLAWNLCGERPHVTDASNASRTLLFDLHSLEWSQELLDGFEVPRGCLPEVVASDARIGTLDGVPGLAGVPVIGMIGDQQASLIGHHALADGEAKVTYGTGAFLLVSTGSRVPTETGGLLATVVCGLGNGHTFYALEGSSVAAGTIVDWLVHGMGLAASPEALETLAYEVPDACGTVLVPAFTGLLAPRWRLDAVPVLRGFSPATRPAHLARAGYDAIAMQVDDLFCAAERYGTPPRQLRADGGASASDLLLQLQADALGVPVERSEQAETTTLGAALLGFTGLGALDGPSFDTPPAASRTFLPRSNAAERARARASWEEAIVSALPTTGS